MEVSAEAGEPAWVWVGHLGAKVKVSHPGEESRFSLEGRGQELVAEAKDSEKGMYEKVRE